MLTRRHFTLAGLAGSALSHPICSYAYGESAPKVMRLLVGFPAGGSVDVVARLLAAELTAYAPQIIVENKPGAGGRIALETLKHAIADGSVAVLTPGDQLTLFPHVYKQLSYDTLKDFVPVTTVCAVQFVLTVGPLVPTNVATSAEFVAWAKANPPLAKYGTPGHGTRPHFIGEALSRAIGVDLGHVPYKGGPQAMQDLLAGQIAASISVLSNVIPHVQAKTLRALATTAGRRSDALPDVPTFKEIGYPLLEAVESFGLLLPSATPYAIADRLATVVQQAVQSDAVKAGLVKLSFEPTTVPRSQYAAQLATETERWRAAVHASGFTALE